MIEFRISAGTQQEPSSCVTNLRSIGHLLAPIRFRVVRRMLHSSNLHASQPGMLAPHHPPPPPSYMPAAQTAEQGPLSTLCCNMTYAGPGNSCVPEVVSALLPGPPGQLPLYPALGLQEHKHGLHHPIGCTQHTQSAVSALIIQSCSEGGQGLLC